MTQAIQSSREASREDRSAGEHRQFVVFSLGGQHYCIDIMSVREIRVVQTITALPGAAEYVRGIINLRGTIVPVFDLRKRFGLGETTIAENQALVIVAVGGHLAALLVDEVLDILSSASDVIAAVPASDSSRRSPFFEGLVSQGDMMLIIIDLDRIVEAGIGHDESGALGAAISGTM